jgi:hypothetical protein
VHHLGVPLGRHVLERDRIDDREADEEDVGVGVRQRAQSVVLLLAGCVPEAELDRLVAGRQVDDVVVEDGGNVVLGKAVVGVSDEKARFADGCETVRQQKTIQEREKKN